MSWREIAREHDEAKTLGMTRTPWPDHELMWAWFEEKWPNMSKAIRWQIRLPMYEIGLDGRKRRLVRPWEDLEQVKREEGLA